MTKLQELREAIIRVVPELGGKHFFEAGYSHCKFCDVEMYWEDRKTLRIDEESGGSLATVTGYCEIDKPCFKNFRRQIGLADVLLAISKGQMRGSYYVRDEGTFFLWYDFAKSKNGHCVGPLYKNWDLAKPLEEQETNTINFLHWIICQNTSADTSTTTR